MSCNARQTGFLVSSLRFAHPTRIRKPDSCPITLQKRKIGRQDDVRCGKSLADRRTKSASR